MSLIRKKICPNRPWKLTKREFINKGYLSKNAISLYKGISNKNPFTTLIDEEEEHMIAEKSDVTSQDKAHIEDINGEGDKV